jgi:hypothetical protein
MDPFFLIKAAPLLSAGFTANPALGVHVGAELRGEMVSVGIEIRYVLPGRVDATEPADPILESSVHSFDLSQISALLVPCLRFATYFAGCLPALGGAAIAHPPVELGVVALFAIGPRLTADYPFTERFGIYGFGEALVTGTSAPFEFLEPGPGGKAPNVLWYPGPVSGYFGAGLWLKLE